MSEWLDFLGRLHPLVLHLPIGFFLLALLMELRGGFRPDSPWAGPARFAFGWAVLAALLAVGTGWLLAGEDHDRELLDRHRWLAVATALGMIVTWLACRQGLRRWARIGAGALTLVLLTLAAHAGGSLSHGEDFLTSAWPLARGAAQDSAPKAPASNAVRTQLQTAVTSTSKS